jgi:hypothetical protein
MGLSFVSGEAMEHKYTGNLLAWHNIVWHMEYSNNLLVHIPK